MIMLVRKLTAYVCLDEGIGKKNKRQTLRLLCFVLSKLKKYQVYRRQAVLWYCLMIQFLDNIFLSEVI